MDINNISLPSHTIADLYTHSLIDSLPAEMLADTDVTGWKSLGDNQKSILVIVNSPDAVHLPDEQLTFLTNMLTACKLSLADVAIVNLNQQQGHFNDMQMVFSARICLLFGISPADFGLPMNFPHFQIQPYANCSFLYAPSLAEMEHDKVAKGQLWSSLKRLFNL